MALLCYDLLRCYLTPADYLFVEPSAGHGAFSRLFPLGSRAYDIDPKNESIVRIDFFDVDLPYRDMIAVVGNPPFGKNASMAIKFFNHAARRADIIAFIVPRSFQKPSIQKRLHRHFHLRREWPIPDGAFQFDGTPKTALTVFQIWEWAPERRAVPIFAMTHPDFVFTKRDEADFMVRRIGGHVGKVHREFEQSDGSNYFIRAKKHYVETILTEIDFTPVAARTTGNPSLTKPELVV